ncbi:MAG: 1-acyl-sn-glycerol-3-phosphate acyltransferase [Actinomycetota bacterium]
MREDTYALEDKVAAIASELTGERAPEPESLLPLDSLGRVELALALEEAFGVQLDEGEALLTIRHATSQVVEKLGEPIQDDEDLLAGVGALQPLAVRLAGRLCRRYYRMEVEGTEHIPTSGPAVLAANHESFWDIPLLVFASPRPIVFMAKEELYGSFLGAWFFTKLGGFQVRRGTSDVLAVRTGLAVVRGGQVLGMYPESTRRVGELLPFYPGAAWVALAEGVRLIPVGITGTGASMPKGSKAPRRVRVRIAFGPSLEVQRQEEPRKRLAVARDLTMRLREAVQELISN